MPRTEASCNRSAGLDGDRVERPAAKVKSGPRFSGDVVDPGGGDPGARPGRAAAGRRARAAWLLGWIDPGRLGILASRAWPRPSLDRNPVLWREWQRRRLSRWGLVVWGTYVLFCGGFSAYAIAGMIVGNHWSRELGAVINGLQVEAGLLLLRRPPRRASPRSVSGAALTC